MSQIQPPIQPPVQPAVQPPVQQPQHPTSAQVAAKPPIRSKTMLVLGIIAAVVGFGIASIGGLVAVAPMALFVLGGGGNTDAFAEFAQGPLIAGGVIVLFGVLLAIAGVVLIVVGARRRRR